MTGFELISTLRSEGATVPIIVMSGRVVLNNIELIRQIKALDPLLLLPKPFSDDQLLHTVASAIAIATG